MKPVVDGLKQEYSGKVGFQLLNLDKGEGTDLANRMGVTAVPTFIFVNGDGVVASTRVGPMTKAEMREALDGLK